MTKTELKEHQTQKTDPKGYPVINGQIPSSIPPESLSIILEENKVMFNAMVCDPDLSKYFKLQLAEHTVIDQNMECGWSSEKDNELKRIREEVQKLEEEYPDFKSVFTDYMNQILIMHLRKELNY